MRALLLTAFLLSTLAVTAQETISFTPETVPNVKLVNNSYVSNPSNILSESTVAQINSILGDVEQQSTAQVAVVVLGSIGDADIFNFAQELFELWGIGRSNNNGLLLLLVKDQRTVRFHTGYQLEGVLPDARCKQIERNSMVPYFKQDDYDAGILSGVEEVSKILTDPNYSIELTAKEGSYTLGDYTAFAIFIVIFLGPIFLIAWAIKARRFSDSKNPARTDFKQMRLKRRAWLIEFGGIPLLILIGFSFVPPDVAGWQALVTIYFYLMATILHRLWRERKMINDFIEKRKYFEITDYLRRSQWYWLFMAIIFPVPFLAYFPFHYVRKRIYRNHARTCKLCNKEMIKLSEIEDDQYLTTAEQLEESIRSVDYDVWKCTGCSATEGWAFRNHLSKYKPCPSCKATAYYRASNRTLVSATYSSSGKGEETFECKACNKSVRKTYTIAQLTSSSDSSSSGGSSGSSSSSSGSWGGGSSGGGGASSSW